MTGGEPQAAGHRGAAAPISSRARAWVPANRRGRRAQAKSSREAEGQRTGRAGLGETSPKLGDLALAFSGGADGGRRRAWVGDQDVAYQPGVKPGGLVGASGSSLGHHCAYAGRRQIKITRADSKKIAGQVRTATTIAEIAGTVYPPRARVASLRASSTSELSLRHAWRSDEVGARACPGLLTSAALADRSRRAETRPPKAVLSC